MLSFLKAEKKKKRKALGTCDSDDEKSKNKIRYVKGDHYMRDCVLFKSGLKRNVFSKNSGILIQERNRTTRV
jgi:hypothetical protein